jgi:septation ring formation regulator
VDIFVTVIIILLVLFTAGTAAGIFLRRHIHKAVDELDARKINLLNRDIPDEIAKVKKLRMSGETEQKFEMWRKDWDEIVESILPSIENQLIEIEEWAAKYRFKKAKDAIGWVGNRIATVEQQLDTMVEEIDHLVSAEAKNRQEISEVRGKYQELSNELLTKRGSFGEAVRALDEAMADIKQTLASYDEATENGSYLQARKQLLMMKDRLHDLRAKMDEIPQLLIQVKSTVPADVRNLEMGIAQMEESGFHLKTFAFDGRLTQFKKDIEKAYEQLLSLHVKEASELLQTINDEKEQMYETLEAEVAIKNKLMEKIPTLKEQVQAATEQLQTLLRETTHVQKSYLIAEEETHLQNALQKDLANLRNQLHVIVDVTENQKQTYSSIYEMAEKWSNEMDTFKANIDNSIERLRRLRKDELKAQETVSRLRSVMYETKRTLKKSNLPGVPVKQLEALDFAETKVKQASDALNEIPLEMERVEQLVHEAIEQVEKGSDAIEEMVEKARLAELAIQFSNRYRNRGEEVRQALDQAEDAFRSFHYEEALERVQHAVEPYEPNLLEKVERHISA